MTADPEPVLPASLAYDCEGARREYERQLNLGPRFYFVDPESWRKVWRMLLVDNHDPGDEDSPSCAAWRGGTPW